MPRVTLIVDLLHRSSCDTTGMYRNTSPSDVFKFVEQFTRYLSKSKFYDLSGTMLPFISDLLTSKVDTLHTLALWTTRADLHQNRFKPSCLQVP